MTTPPVTPESITPKVWWDSEVMWMPHWVDADGNPLVNSAGGLYPKPVLEQVCIPVCHVIRWKELSDAERKDQSNATNASAWHEWEAGQAWVARIIDETEETNSSPTQKVHYIIKCCEFGWDNKFLEMGYFHGTTTKNSFQTADGVPYIGLLDAAGSEGGPVVAGQRLKRRIDLGTALGY